MTPLLALVARDLRLAARSLAEAGAVLAFFAIAVALLPLGIGPDPAVLARIAPGAAWVAALLAAMLSLDRLFAGDQEDGSLDLLLLPGPDPRAAVLAKCLAHWLATGLPLALLAPAGALALGMPSAAATPLALALLAGTPALSLIGAVGAALTATLRRGGLLAPLLVLPQAVPVLVFGAAAAGEAAAGRDPGPHLAVLAALSLALAALAPFAAVAALRAGRA